MLHMPTPMLLSPGPSAPRGQALFLAAADYAEFIVPAGVFSICAVAIGRGGPAATNRSGSGGGLAYVNNYAVTPGQAFDVQALNGSPDFGIYPRAGGTLLLVAGASSTGPGGPSVGTGFNGGQGASSVSGQDRSGAGAGGYTSAGEDTGLSATLLGGGGSSPNGGGAGGAAGAAPTIDGGAYGGGAAKRANNTFGSQGPGCVRIIWGAGRAFPNTDTGDV